jgi:chromosome segregation ATPase
MDENKELENLQAKLTKIEYTEIKNLKEEIQQIKLDLNTNNILTKQCTESNEKLSNTLDGLRSTLIEVAQSVKDSNGVVADLATTVKDLNDKVNKVETTMNSKFDTLNNRMDDIDEKSKVDILKFFKGNIIGILMGVGALIYALSQIGINL